MAKQSILIIEDDKNMGKLVQQAFDEAGFATFLETSGRAGLDRAIAVTPTAILLDVIIPDMTGWDVMVELKKNPKTKEIPVIVDTNLASEEREMDFLREGAKAFLVKSQYDPRAIVKKVEEILAAK